MNDELRKNGYEIDKPEERRGEAEETLNKKPR